MASKVFMDKGAHCTNTLEIADTGDGGNILAMTATTDPFGPQVSGAITVQITPNKLRGFAKAVCELADKYDGENNVTVVLPREGAEILLDLMAETGRLNESKVRGVYDVLEKAWWSAKQGQEA